MKAGPGSESGSAGTGTLDNRKVNIEMRFIGNEVIEEEPGWTS